MSNRRNRRLTMPKPCTADYEQMADVGNGRFCKQCNKTVHDVSLLPDEALQVFLNAPERVCMRLHEDQLDRDIAPARESHQALSSNSISICIINDLMPGSLLNIPIQDDGMLKGSWLTGYLLNATDQRPLAHAIISVGVIGLAFSDDSGWFKLFIPEATVAHIVSFSVSLNTHADSYREIVKQSIQISPSKVQLQNNNTLTYHPFTQPTSVKTSGACTFIQTSA